MIIPELSLYFAFCRGLNEERKAIYCHFYEEIPQSFDFLTIFQYICETGFLFFSISVRRGLWMMRMPNVYSSR